MNKLVPLGVGIAAVAVAVLVGGQLIASPAPEGVGAVPSVEPSPTPTPTATAMPTPSTVAEASPAPIPADGTMRPGVYVTHGWPASDGTLTLTFTVPAGWHGFGDGTIFPDGADGTALQFIRVTALNSDLCHWKDPKGDVNVGTTVDDLVEALVAQTKFEVSDPVAVSIGGYSGKRVDASTRGAETIAQAVQAATGVEADSWIKTNAQFFTAVNAQQSSNTLIRVFVGLSVAFGIASVLVVSVIQRSKDIGILRAMGTSQGQILRVFLLQGGLLGLLGSIVGAAAGASASQVSTAYMG